jgi:hypothetical protein
MPSLDTHGGVPKKQRNDLVIVGVVTQMSKRAIVGQGSQLVKRVAGHLGRQVMCSGFESQAGENAVDSFSSRLVFRRLTQKVVAMGLAEIHHGLVCVAQSGHGHVYEDGVADGVQGDRVRRI